MAVIVRAAGVANVGREMTVVRHAQLVVSSRFGKRTLRFATVIASALLAALQMLQAQTGGSKLNPFAAKEPMVADPNRAFPRVSSLPGLSFKPVTYDATSIIVQLAHSSDGVVRLPPGDYSIPVRFY
jgi:hypothetical protein